MKSTITEDFRALFDELPAGIQKQARTAYQRFKENPSYPGLRFHKVTLGGSGKELYSASIGIHYRALAQDRGGTLEWFWIGHHSVYDKLLAGR